MALRDTLGAKAMCVEERVKWIGSIFEYYGSALPGYNAQNLGVDQQVLKDWALSVACGVESRRGNRPHSARRSP